MILLKELELKNFLSHEHTVINFADHEKLLIDGKSGAGKSSIVDAVVWGLYNMGRGNPRSLIKRGAKEAEVSIYLFDKLKLSPLEPLWQIKRKITSKGVHTVEVLENGIPAKIAGTRNIQNYIEKELLKCSLDLFLNSVCYMQEHLDSFARTTPARRKDLILELVRAEDYEAHYEKTREAIGNINQTLAQNQGGILQYQQELEELHGLIENLETYQLTVVSLAEALHRIDVRLEELRQQDLKNIDIENELKLLNKDITFKNAEFARLENERQTILGEIEKLKSIDESVITQKIERLRILKEEFKNLEKAYEKRNQWKTAYINLLQQAPFVENYKPVIEQLNKSIIALQSKTFQKEICSNCGQEHVCTLIENETKERIKDLSSQLVVVHNSERLSIEARSEHGKRIEDLKQQEPKLDEQHILAVKKEISQLEPFEQEAALLQQRTNLLKDRKTKLILNEKASLEIKAETDKIKVAQTSLSLSLVSVDVNLKILLRQERDQKQGEYMAAMETLALAKQAKDRQVLIQNKVQANELEIKNSQTDLANLLLLKEALGSNGIRAIVIDYVIPQLEERINHVLQKFSDFQIRIDTQKSNTTGDDIIEGLFLTVVNSQGEEMDLANYSGGEKQRIMVAISEGLAELQKIGFRILDEAVVGLDEETVDGFINTLLLMQERFNQLICISHLPAVKNEFEKVLTVVNQNGNSRII